MNFKELMRKQLEIDKLILENNNISTYPLDKMRIAYRVELGELLNEWQNFKFWKKNKTFSKKDFLLEFADCLAFALSLESQCPFYTPYKYESLDEVNIGYIYAMVSLNDVIDMCFECLPSVLMNTIVLGHKLGITLDEMERAYNYKYKINLERQQNGY